MQPLDPGREWLAAGITGLQRQREWDAVATAEVDGIPGDEVEFVALPDGTFVIESEGGADPTAFADALGDDIERPFRALAVRRPGVWAVGAVSIEVDRLDPDPRGNELELTWNGTALELTIDDVPAEPGRAEALQRIATSRVAGPYAAHAHRLRDDVWELSVLAL
jgi:hypothetical protein